MLYIDFVSIISPQNYNFFLTYANIYVFFAKKPSPIAYNLSPFAS